MKSLYGFLSLGKTGKIDLYVRTTTRVTVIEMKWNVAEWACETALVQAMQYLPVVKRLTPERHIPTLTDAVFVGIHINAELFIDVMGINYKKGPNNVWRPEGPYFESRLLGSS